MSSEQTSHRLNVAAIYRSKKFTFFFRQCLADDLLAGGDEGEVVLGQDVVGLVDPRHLAESGPREFLVGRREVDAVVDESSVEVGLFLPGPTFPALGFLEVPLAKNLLNGEIRERQYGKIQQDKCRQ